MLILLSLVNNYRKFFCDITMILFHIPVIVILIIKIINIINIINIIFLNNRIKLYVEKLKKYKL